METIYTENTEILNAYLKLTKPGGVYVLLGVGYYWYIFIQIIQIKIKFFLNYVLHKKVLEVNSVLIYNMLWLIKLQ